MPPSRVLVLPRDYPRGRPFVQGASLVTLWRNQLPNKKVSFHVRELIPARAEWRQPLGKPSGANSKTKRQQCPCRRTEEGVRSTLILIRTSQNSFQVRLIRPRLTSLTRSFRASKWTHVGHLHARCARSLPNVMRLKRSWKELSNSTQQELHNACPIGRTLAVALTRLRPIRHAPGAIKSTRMRPQL
jgi:hypothetical protein